MAVATSAASTRRGDQFFVAYKAFSTPLRGGLQPGPEGNKIKRKNSPEAYPAGIKIVPSNIAELLTPLGLAYWICDDGCLQASGGLQLCTNSFSIQDVTLLRVVLITRFGLNCTIQKDRNKYVIYITKNSMDKLIIPLQVFQLFVLIF